MIDVIKILFLDYSPGQGGGSLVRNNSYFGINVEKCLQLGVNCLLQKNNAQSSLFLFFIVLLCYHSLFKKKKFISNAEEYRRHLFPILSVALFQFFFRKSSPCLVFVDVVSVLTHPLSPGLNACMILAQVPCITLKKTKWLVKDRCVILVSLMKVVSRIFT